MFRESTIQQSTSQNWNIYLYPSSILVGLLDCWIVGVLDCWIAGLLDCWIVGLLGKMQHIGCRDWKTKGQTQHPIWHSGGQERTI
jgi:hypothetical protein